MKQKLFKVIKLVVILTLIATIFVSCSNQPSGNTNSNSSISSNQPLSSPTPLRLDQIQNEVRSKGYSFTVGDTGLLNTPLKELTGGQKLQYSEDEAKKIEARAKELENQGLIPSSKKFKMDSGGPISATDLQPPFDWEQQVKKPAFDWRSFRPVTQPKRQFTCGACWAFAAASLTEMFDSVFFKKAVDISEQDILNCSVGGCGGGFLSDGLETLQNKGAATESEVPFQKQKETCNLNVKKCFKINFHGFVDPNWGTPSVERMKQYIYQWGGVGVFMIATDTMEAYTGGVYDEFAETGENHFVVILGWDDNKVHRKGKGAWLIKNSWGISWGENGFGWVPYEANQIGFNAQMVSAGNPSPGCQ